MYSEAFTYHRPEGGRRWWLSSRTWLSWLLLLVAMASVVLGITDVLWGLEFGFLFLVAVLAVLMQWVFASLPISQRLAAALGGVLGLEYVLVRAGELEPSIGAALERLFVFLRDAVVWLWRDLGALFMWLSQWEWDEGLVWVGTPAWAVPPNWAVLRDTWLTLWAVMADLLLLGQEWLWSLLRGEPLFDALAATLAWGLVIWGLASWASWATHRHHRPLLGILPAGVVLAFVISYTGAPPISLYPLVLSSLLLLAMSHHRARELHWRRSDMDFARDLWVKLFWIVAALSVVLLLAAALIPPPSSNFISEWLDDLVRGEQQETAMDTLADSLGMERQPQPTQVAPAPVGPGPGLPDEHVVSAGPQLSNRIMMYVSTSDLQPVMDGSLMDFDAPVYRWRSYTYDTYTGAGWVTTDTQEITYEAGVELVDTETMTRHRVLRQTVMRTGDRSNIVRVSGSLVAVDQDYTVKWRDANDFFGATADVRSYRADALVPRFTEVELRETGTDYPDWVVERYLQLPDTVPERVLDLAAELTVYQVTPYDKARALEAYMRTYSYTLEVPAPPDGREVADYFLFDLQKGYCDYYSTSMVVLARAAGLPARPAFGYIGGMYDPVQAQYAVSEDDAHSWVEIYFPDYGWIEFEPTAGRPAIERISGMVDEPEMPPWPPSDADPLVRPPEPEPSRLRMLGRLLLPAIVFFTPIIGILLAASMLDNIVLLARGDGQYMATRLYHRLRDYAQRLRVVLSKGDTPHEFAIDFFERLEVIADDRPFEVFVDAAEEEIKQLIEAYVLAWYAPQSVDAATRRAAVWAWWKLRWRLWFAYLWRRARPSETSVAAPAVWAVSAHE